MSSRNKKLTLAHDIAFCSQIFDQKRDFAQSTRSRKGANSKRRLLEIAGLFRFFQSSPDLTKSQKSPTFHWQCEELLLLHLFFSFFLSPSPGQMLNYALNHGFKGWTNFTSLNSEQASKEAREKYLFLFHRMI